nr:hypothetical protein [Providencia rustigianii]
MDFVVIAQAPAIECVYDRKKDEPMFSGMGDKKQWFAIVWEMAQYGGKAIIRVSH